METSGRGSKRILVVEDEPSICEICQQVLTSEGFEVDTAENGKVAEAMILENPYDMFLIDIRMPEVNGKELYKWLKQNRPKMAKRVIFTTGDIIGGDIKSFLDEAERPLLAKPFTLGELESLIKEVFKEFEK